MVRDCPEQPAPLGLGRPHRPAGREQVQRDGVAHASQDAGGDERGQQTPARLREGEAGGLATDDGVAGEREAEPGAEGETVHDGQDRLRAPHRCRQQPRHQLGMPLDAVAVGQAVGLDEVGAGAEAGPGRTGP